MGIDNGSVYGCVRMMKRCKCEGIRHAIIDETDE